MKITGVLLVLFFSLKSVAQTSPELTTHRDSINLVAERIREGRMVTSNHIGFAGMPSAQWFRAAYLASFASEQELLEIISDTNPALRFYAYLALLHKGSDQLIKVRDQLKDDTTIVVTLSGCIADEKPLNQLVQQIENWYMAKPVNEFQQRIAGDSGYRQKVFASIFYNQPLASGK